MAHLHRPVRVAQDSRKFERVMYCASERQRHRLASFTEEAVSVCDLSLVCGKTRVNRHDVAHLHVRACMQIRLHCSGRMGGTVACLVAVSYTHLTLPTKRIV